MTPLFAGRAIAGIGNVLGFLIARLVIRVFGVIGGETQRLLPVLLPVILVIPILGLTLLLPESPRWLLLRGRDAEAKDVLASLSLDDLESEYNKIWTSAQEEVGRRSWSQLLSRRGQASRRMILGVLLQSW